MIRNTSMNTQHNPSRPNPVICEFSRDCIEQKQFGFFVDRWAPHRLPHGQALLPLMDSMVFRLRGYDPRQLCTIPEVRRFCQDFFEAWPFWFFTGNLDTPNLAIMVYGCLHKLRAVGRQATSLCQVSPDPEELHQFVQRGLCAMTCLCKRAGMTESEIALRSTRILEYFKSDWSDLPSQPTGGKPGWK